MEKPTCPKCGSDRVLTERRPNGDSQCADCVFKWPTGLYEQLHKAAAHDELVAKLREHVATLRRSARTLTMFRSMTHAAKGEALAQAADELEALLPKEE